MKFKDIKGKIEEIENENRRMKAEGLANIILLYKTTRHFVVKTPEAIRKKKEEIQKGNADKSTSYFKYIDTDELENSVSYDEMVKDAESKIKKFDEISNKITKWMNPIFWIKK